MKKYIKTENRAKKEDWKQLGIYIKRERKKYLLGIILALVAAVASVGSSFTLKILVDDVLLKNKPEYIWPIQWIFIGLVCLQTVFSIFKEKVYMTAANNVLERMRGEMCKRILHCEYESIEQKKQGEVLGLFQYDVDGLSGYLSSGIGNLCSSIITIVFTVGVMCYLNVGLTMLTLPIFPLILILFMKLNKLIEQKARMMQQMKRENISYTNQILRGIIGIRMINGENMFQNRYMNSVVRMQKTSMNLQIVYLVMRMASWSMIMVPYQALLYGVAGNWFIKTGTPSIGLMLTFANLANSLIEPVLCVQRFFGERIYAGVCVHNISEVMTIPQEKLDGTDLLETSSKYEYQIKEMSFRYKCGKKAIERLSVQFKPNALNLICGKSGSGKSTILKLLARIYQPESGNIMLNGKNIKEISLESYRKIIAYVNQDQCIFDGSIKGSLVVVNNEISEEEIWEVLKKVNLEEEVKLLPNKLDTEIGEDGELLSGGQRQRLAIAQALIKGAKIILLDEPTSALDKLNEERIINTLNKLKKDHTIIMTSHSLEVRKNVDFLLEI